MEINLLSFRALFILIFIAAGCEDEKLSPDTSATLDGDLTTFTKNKATDTGSGLEIVLANESDKITIQLNGTTSDSYAIQNRAGRVAATSRATISVIHDSKVYYGTGGSIEVSSTNGTLVVQINELTLKSWSGETVELSSVHTEEIEIKQVPQGCRIASYSYSVAGILDCYQDLNYSLSYNGEGKVVRAYGPDSDLSFIYDIDEKLLGYSGVTATAGGNLLVNLQLSYTGTRLSSFALAATPDSDSVNTIYYPLRTYSLTYDGDKISGATVSYSTSNGFSDTYLKTISYNGSNMSQLLSSYEDGGMLVTEGYTSFDSKKNPYHLLATLMASDVSFINGGFDHDFDLLSLQGNNPLSRTMWAGEETFGYSYNTAGYPTQIVFTPHSEEYCTAKVTIAISYDGCQ